MLCPNFHYYHLVALKDDALFDVSHELIRILAKHSPQCRLARMADNMWNAPIKYVSDCWSSLRCKCKIQHIREVNIYTASHRRPGGFAGMAAGMQNFFAAKMHFRHCSPASEE